MTSSRVVRGTKGRILLCICAILIITGIIACYNNTLSQLDDVRKTNDQCHQQQENLSTQLQVIFDYKQRLEKSLKTEKAEHQQSKKDLESKLREERSQHEIATNDANLKFAALQQHYNLLQTQHDDFKEECSKIQRQQLDELNTLQSKLKEVQGQWKQAVSDKENSLEHLKTQFLQLQDEKRNLEKQVKGTQGNHLQSQNEINHLTKLNHELQRELEEVKAKYSVPPELYKAIQEPLGQSEKSPPANHSAHTTTNFSRQVDIGHSEYQIRNSQNNPLEPKQDPGNVADLPSNADEQQPALEQVDAPKTENEIKNIEQFNNNENVLAAPNDANVQLMNQKSSSTTRISMNSKAVSKASLDAAQPLHLPTITPSSVKNKPSQESRIFNQDPRVLPLPYAHKKLPVGVVPVPDTPLETVDESKVDARKTRGEEKDIRDDVNNAFPNRYRTNLILNEIVNEDKAIEADKQEQINEVSKDVKPQNILKSDVGDKENNALEVFDPPVNNNDKGLDADPFGLDDTHNNEKLTVKRTHQKLHLPHNNALGVEGMKLNDGQVHRVYDAQEGIDYDKDVQNDMQLEENDPEAEDDDPEYADHIARQKDPAVRN